MNAKVIVTPEKALRIEGNVIAQNPKTNIVMFCDGGRRDENLPFVFLDASVFDSFETVYITGYLIAQ